MPKYEPFRYLGWRLWPRTDTATPCWYALKDGSTTKRTLDTANYDEAKERLVDLAHREAELRHVAPERAGLRMIFERYMEGRGGRARSAKPNRRQLDFWLAFFGTDATLADITRGRQEAFEDWLRAEYSQAYTRRTFEIGKAAIAYAYDRGEIATQPAIKLPDRGDPDFYAPTFDEFVAFWDAIGAPHIATFVLICALTSHAGTPARRSSRAMNFRMRRGVLVDPGAVSDLIPGRLDVEHRPPPMGDQGPRGDALGMLPQRVGERHHGSLLVRLPPPLGVQVDEPAGSVDLPCGEL